MDWKSLTIPACLPITTDYFPDKRSLHNDYVLSDYTLLPEDVNADYASSRAVYQKPLTTLEVFRELISQRLAQGFQLIVVAAPQNQGTGATAPCCGGQLNQSPARQPIRPSQTPVGSLNTSSVLKTLPPQEDAQEYRLSIGRMFHKISLVGNAITVTRYRPRLVLLECEHRFCILFWIYFINHLNNLYYCT